MDRPLDNPTPRTESFPDSLDKGTDAGGTKAIAEASISRGTMSDLNNQGNARAMAEKFEPRALEEKWGKFWQETNLYRWNPDRPRNETFVVDTPPPTVSGSLHMGHVFSYTHTDVLVRYKRMLGMNIMYPMGWDDNGLPTERRVQNVFNIDCNPNLPYQPAWKPTPSTDKEAKRVEISRQNFIEACDSLTIEDEKVFAALWKRLGLSLDWGQEYNTIGAHCRTVSQHSFLDLVAKGEVYQIESPTIWDVTFKTAVAQAELEDRMIPGLFHDVEFAVKGGGSFTIATTRPEMLVSCIAVVAHPDDARYQGLFGKQALTPLFNIPVPILASEHADPKKGSGIMMVCTFGDSADLAWWKTSNLPLRMAIGRDGRMQPISFDSEPFLSENPQAAKTAYERLMGKTTNQARKEMALLLAEPGSGIEGRAALIGTPKQLEHAVKFYEKGERPVEFVSSRQWYVKLLPHREALIEQGRKIQWHPEHMRSRYENWVSGLNQDWCISRQRFFGVPFPVWYPVDNSGETNFQRPIFASLESLPVDPLSQAPKGYDESQRGKPGGFIGDPDVMDTWATSSMSPQIMSHWGSDLARHQKLFPMDLRPQSHEIIRTWAFYTIAKAWLHEQALPWSNVSISGWILDPDRKKMSKSKGNVVTPDALLEKFSSDAVRYWAARARLGVDTAFDEKVFDSGRKMANKLFNASRFVLMQLNQAQIAGEEYSLKDVTLAIDLGWLKNLGGAIEASTKSFEQFDHAGALTHIERVFWDFCDNYLELAKERSYVGSDVGKKSAHATLSATLSAFARLFAPYMPYVTEEVWSAVPWNNEGLSVHVAQWPKTTEWSGLSLPTTSASYELAVAVLASIRKAKGDAHKGMRWPVASLKIEASPSDVPLLQAIMPDVQLAGVCPESAIKIESNESIVNGNPVCSVSLAEVNEKIDS